MMPRDLRPIMGPQRTVGRSLAGELLPPEEVLRDLSPWVVVWVDPALHDSLCLPPEELFRPPAVDSAAVMGFLEQCQVCTQKAILTDQMAAWVCPRCAEVTEPERVLVADLYVRCSFSEAEGAVAASDTCQAPAVGAVETPAGDYLYRCHSHRGIIARTSSGGCVMGRHHERVPRAQHALWDPAWAKDPTLFNGDDRDRVSFQLADGTLWTGPAADADAMKRATAAIGSTLAFANALLEDMSPASRRVNGFGDVDVAAAEPLTHWPLLIPLSDPLASAILAEVKQNPERPLIAAVVGGDTFEFRGYVQRRGEPLETEWIEQSDRAGTTEPPPVGPTTRWGAPIPAEHVYRAAADDDEPDLGSIRG